jgi:hypothetical protein
MQTIPCNDGLGVLSPYYTIRIAGCHSLDSSPMGARTIAEWHRVGRDMRAFRRREGILTYLQKDFKFSLAATRTDLT